MFAEERKLSIIQMMQMNKPVKVGELSQMFSVSESTIRRDLQELENSGLIQRIHGGAISIQSGSELSFREKEIQNLESKTKIAKAGISLVQDGESLLLDAGTTTLQIAKGLRGRPVTVATNSMDIAQVFLDDAVVEVVVLGGVFRKVTHSLVGGITNTAIQNFYFDKVFLAANGVTAAKGITTPALLEAETKRCMLKAGKERILVADSSKIGEKSLCKVCDLQEIDLVITDAFADVRELQAMKELVQVMNVS